MSEKQYDIEDNQPESVEKTYTLADLEQARKQGAEDERARLLEAIAEVKRIPNFYDSSKEDVYFAGIREAMRVIRSLGPIGETREETEWRVRQKTIDKLRGSLFHDGMTERTKIRLVDVFALLDAIAEEK